MPISAAANAAKREVFPIGFPVATSRRDSARIRRDTIAMRVPVLTYHSNNVGGNDYTNNDHVALAEDLRRIHAAGLRIVPLSQVVDVRLDAADEATVENAIALCCDDGSWFDWHDMDHPTHGRQRSFAN